MTTLVKRPPETSAGEDRLPDVDLNSFMKRVLSITFILDISASMRGEKITQLNWAVRQLLAKLVEMKTTHFGGIDVRIQVIPFSDTAKTMFAEAMPVSQVIYKDMSASGSTNMVGGIDMWGKELGKATSLGLQPVAILFTDGWPNHDPSRAIERLLSTSAGRCSQRAAIAFGADADRSTLEKFVSEGQKVYEVDSPEELAESLEAATLATIGGSIVGNDEKAQVPEPPIRTQFTQLAGGLTDEERAELLKNGFDPNEFEKE